MYLIKIVDYSVKDNPLVIKEVTNVNDYWGVSSRRIRVVFADDPYSAETLELTTKTQMIEIWPID